MEIFIKEHKEDNFGKVVDMSSLFAAVMLSIGKASKKPSGAKIGELYWCDVGNVIIKTGEVKVGDKNKSRYHVYQDNSEIMKKENIGESVIYCSPLKNNVIFMYENINAVKDIEENSSYICNEQPLEKVLKKNHLWKNDWNEETYLTNDCIENLNSRIFYNQYTVSQQRNKEIIV